MRKFSGLAFFFSLFSAAAYGQAATDEVGLRHFAGGRFLACVAAFSDVLRLRR